MTLRIGLLVFPDIMQLDMTGPHEVFTKLPDTQVMLVWKSLEPVKAAGGMRILPDVTYADCPQLDVICVPGGSGMNALLNDEETLGFLRKQAETARYATSVCTGSLVLGAAGLLKGRRAACHWMSRDMLKKFGAIPDGSRVVIDGNYVSGGGVTAGIDFGLTLAEKLSDKTTAQMIQLMLEYNPAPPFNSGSPDTAPAEVLEGLRARYATQGAAASNREAAVARAAERNKVAV